MRRNHHAQRTIPRAAEQLPDEARGGEKERRLGERREAGW